MLTFRLANARKPKFECPVCQYCGPFADLKADTGQRKHAQCPQCKSLERHRLQYLVVSMLKAKHDFSTLSLLHIAPERCFRSLFSSWFGNYETADLAMTDVDHQVDLTNLPFGDASYDFVYASHVLEHIRNDSAAIREVRRILRPNGIAVMPVPLVGKTTIEYPRPNPFETYHVRAPGPDYFDRYRSVFRAVEEFGSADFSPSYQLYTYEDRRSWPTEKMPLRRPMDGEKHEDVVPVCYA